MAEPIPVFIVKARKGCYENAFEYLVAAYFDKAAAEDHARSANAWVEVNGPKYSQLLSGQTFYEFPAQSNPHDLRMRGEPATYNVTYCMVHDRPKRRK